jgi:N-acetylglucosaminyldiphosphoundecaprenol N-acetyl-beta-D-mannosaminyltransferase
MLSVLDHAALHPVTTSAASADDLARPVATNATSEDDLSRPVYCVLGMPIDAVDMSTVLHRIERAAAERSTFLISTPNLNFLVNSRSDPEFRESLLSSELCPADGMPIVWIARLIGLPINVRVCGSDIFEALKAPVRCARRLKVFLFGGADGVAAAAATMLNVQPGGLRCAGAISPGFGSIGDMSGNAIIDRINSSDADFLAVSLGAAKGQLWLQRNRHRLTIPVRAHLGAAINFQAGAVKRAPQRLRRWGLEWLWRIKEEPHLWRRYLHDGRVLLRLLLTRVLPLTILSRWHRYKCHRWPQALLIKTAQSHNSVMISLVGDATARHVGKVISCFRETLTVGSRLVIVDLSSVRVIDERFFGLLLMLRKQLMQRGAKLTFIEVSPAIRRIFRLNELGYLLSST